MAGTTVSSGVTAPTTTGATNTQGLADWAAPYVTGYLGQAQALAQSPYQAYQGPLTAGASGLQSNVFQGLGSLNFPSNLGQSFSSAGAYQLPNTSGGMQPGGQSPSGYPTPTMGTNTNGAASQTGPNGMPNTQPSNIAQQYMNPYLQSVLNPQLAELNRQNDITNMTANSKLAGAGAFGGSRQAIMNAENNRNLMQEMNKTVGQGYSNAYDKAMSQFNTEQGQSRDLANLMSQQGGIQRGIEQEGVTADLNEFNQQRQYPYQQVQFQRDMMTGLPVSSVTNTQGSLTGVGAILSALGGATGIASALQNKDVQQLLKNLGLGSLTPTPTQQG
jgi:phosphoglycolate phosphatase-like HAD superfamily hydrolase